MQILGKRVLLKAVKRKPEDLDFTEVDHYEVAFVGDEVNKIKAGDNVVYQQGAQINILGEVYTEVSEENIIAIL